MDIDIKQYGIQLAHMKSELRLLQFSEHGIKRCFDKMTINEIYEMINQYWAFQEKGIEVEDDGA